MEKFATRRHFGIVCVIVAPFLHGRVATPEQSPLNPEDRWSSVGVALPLVTISSYRKALETRLLLLSLSFMYLSITRDTNEKL